MREEAKRGVCRVQRQCAAENRCDAHPGRDIFVSRFGCDPRQRVRAERADARGTRWHARASALLYTVVSYIYRQ